MQQNLHQIPHNSERPDCMSGEGGGGREVRRRRGEGEEGEG